MTPRLPYAAIAAALTAILAAGACSPPASAPGQTPEERPEPEPLAAPAPDAAALPEPADTNPDLAATTGGDGSALRLTGLEAADFGAGLEGELRCAFTDDSGAVLLAAAANVGDDQPIQALVKIGDYVERLSGQEAGGYDRMVNGASYAGRGLTAELTRTSEQSRGAGEGLDYPATLRVDRADGARRVWDGAWTCGP